MGLKVGAYDIMALEVKCSSERKAFGHANARNEDGSGAEGCIAAVVFAKGVIMAEEGRDHIAEEENEGGEWEEGHRDEDEGYVLSEVMMIG